MDIQLIADHGLYRYVVQCIVEYPLYSYLIIFVWTFVEGETIVLFAAFMAAQGLLDPLLLLVVAGFGSYLGDQCYFWLGRHYGVRLLETVSELASRGRERTLLAGAIRCLVHPVVPLHLRRAEFLILRARAQRGSLGAVSAPELSRGDGVGRQFCRDRIFPRSRLQHCRQYRELARLCAARRVRRARLRHLAAAPSARAAMPAGMPSRSAPDRCCRRTEHES